MAKRHVNVTPGKQGFQKTTPKATAPRTMTAGKPAATVPSHTPARSYTPAFAPGEARTLMLAVEAALRTPAGRADKAALRRERADLEARFGAINWAA